MPDPPANKLPWAPTARLPRVPLRRRPTRLLAADTEDADLKLNAGIQQPTNTSPATARELIMPYAEICQVFRAEAPAYEVWYVYAVTTGPSDPATTRRFQLGFSALAETWQTPSPVYRPRTTVYSGSPGSLTEVLSGGENSPLQIPIDEGVTYYFQVRNAGTANIVITQLLVSAKLTWNETANYPIIIPDDVPDFPITILDPGTGVVQQARPFPSGETAAVLPSGVSVWHDRSTQDSVVVKDDLLETIATPVWPRQASIPALSSNRRDRFYIADWQMGVGGRVTTISEAGEMGPTVWTIPYAPLYAIAVAHDDSVLYYSGQNTGLGDIHRFNLATNTPMPPLVGPQDDGRQAGETLVLDDGSIVVGYRDRFPSTDNFARRYAPDGTVLRTYTIPYGNTVQTNRLAHAVTDASFWVWAWGDDSIDHFLEFRVSDGAILNDTASPQYSGGVYYGEPFSPDPVMGHAFSCPFIVFPRILPPYLASPEPICPTIGDFVGPDEP